MRRFQKPLSLVCLSAFLSTTLLGQSNIQIEKPAGSFSWLTNPYRARHVTPINLNNSGRLESLIRAGILYLSAQDVVALALEDNLDIEIQRYGPLLAEENLRRAQSGAALRSVGTSVAAGPTSVSTTGVASNLASSNGGNSAAGNGVNSGGGIVAQLGPTIPTLDPTFSAFVSVGHFTTPQSNTFITQTNAIVANSQTYNFSYGQNFVTGTGYTFSFNNTHSNVNVPSNLLNPSTTGSLDLVVTQSLLQGFGIAVNNRNIRVAKNNAKVNDLQFEQQLITTVASVLNLYWDLVSFNEDVKVKESALVTSRRLFEDNKKQVDIGTLAPIEVTRAEAEVASNQQDLLISQTNLLQQETLLKNALSKNGVASPSLAEVRIVPLDKITLPPQEENRPFSDLVEFALKNRPEITQNQLNIESNKINLNGDKSSLRPSLTAFAELTNHALTGSVNPANVNNEFGFPDPYFVGGYPNALGQMFRRNFPDYSAGFALTIPIRNRAAQADYVTDQLALRQAELQFQKSVNQVRVDVQNAVIGLQQARVRYLAAVKARILQQETLDAEQKKYQLGASTVFLVIQAQRDLSTAQGTEIQALANYSHARVSFDQAIGGTLSKNNISLDEAKKGLVARPSVIPQSPPAPANVTPPPDSLLPAVQPGVAQPGVAQKGDVQH
jgi:outer membrane protein